jgi:peptide/nickel transport system permease protein
VTRSTINSSVPADDMRPGDHAVTENRSGRRTVLARLVRQPASAAALIWLVLLLFVAIFAPVLAPYDPLESDVASRLQGISAAHWLGTDILGRDLLSRTMWGARLALLAAAEVVLIAAAIGIPLGLLVGYKAGWWDRIAMRVAEIEQPIPTVLLAFTLVAILGRGLFNAMLAAGIGFAMVYMRLTRAVVLAEKEKAYVRAAEIQGYSLPRILFRHILPNVSGPLIVQTSIIAGIAILIEATLSFLGIGAPPNAPSWGSMLDDARRFQIQQILLSVVPGTMITLTVLAFNLVGDGLRDALAGGVDTGAQDPAPPSRPPASLAVAPVQPADAALSVRDLAIEFRRADGTPHRVVEGVSFDIRPSEIFGLVGESGSGKSMTASAVLGMVPKPLYVSQGSILFAGRELAGLPPSAWADIRGKDIGVVFQDPVAALSPVHTVGSQIIEGLRRHQGLSRKAALRRAAELLDLVGVPDAASRLKDYPHQFSGGMAQRAMIAAALACEPKLLIADEPTTALDATVQKQVLELMLKLRDTLGMSVLFITHDLGVVAQICDRVGVMRDGALVELKTPSELFARPSHPYTKQLIAAREVVTGSDRWEVQ